MIFYGLKIPDKDLNDIKIKLKEHISRNLGCPTISCRSCVLYFKGKCLPCNSEVMEKYEHLKNLGPSSRRDILFREFINYKSIVQEEFEV